MGLQTARVVAATFALAAFCVAAMAGLLVGNPPATVLLRALAAMGVCWLVGSIVGTIAQQLVSDEIAAHRVRNPVEDVVLPGEETGVGPNADETSDSGEDGILVV
jgi:hypothetical protein